MDFTGQIKHIGEMEQFDTKDGRKVFSRDIVVTTDEQYPRSACFTLRNEQAQAFSLNIGQRIRVTVTGFGSTTGAAVSESSATVAK